MFVDYINDPSEHEVKLFEDWLRSVLREPDHAPNWADFLVSAHDWSASNIVEVPSHATRDGHPITYSF